MARPKALIETLDLFDNYGGVLQTYAMQRLLEENGVASVTETPTRRRLGPRTVARRLLRAAKTRRVDRAVPLTVLNEAAANLRQFVEDNVATIEPTRCHRQRDAFVRTATFGVAGSDQIWRPAYTDVWRNLFDFPGGRHLRKIAYAGSFGLGDLSEFSDSDLRRFGRLLGRFEAVSVREISAKKLLKENFGIDSAVVLDPTLVVDPDVWRDLSATAPSASSTPYLAYMVLDRREDLTRAVAERAKADSLALLDFYPPQVTSRRAFRAAPGRFVLPGVPEWLRTLRDADLVVTDSFHVCVFSMIFGRPFVCVKNQDRGAARFDSLEELLGIRGAFVSDPKEVLAPRIGLVGDDRYVRIAEMRAVSRSFLTNSLSRPPMPR